MRCLALCATAAIAGCAASGTDTIGQEPLRAACDQGTNCFYQRSVRDYQVLDDSTLVVFVGANRCPFVVRVEGFFCQLRSSAFLGFQDLDGRICNLDRSFVVGGPFVREDNDCRVREVEPLNDDELIETFAAHGILEPLPTSGAGELEVVEETAEGEAAPAEQGAAEPVIAAPEATADTS